MEKEARKLYQLTEVVPNSTQQTKDSIGQISDGSHTFDELYQHRYALFIALAYKMPHRAWKSRNHQKDGDPMYPGYFIAGISLPTGDISYHLPISFWSVMDGITTLTNAPEWDGHTPEMVVDRLVAFAGKEAVTFRAAMDDLRKGE